MTTTTKNAPESANELLRPFAMHHNGKAIAIDVERLRKFRISELAAIAETFSAVYSLLLSAQDRIPLAEGDADLTPAGRFVEEVGQWFALLGDVLDMVIHEAVPSDWVEASRKYAALLEREAACSLGAPNFLGLAKLAMDAAEEIRRLQAAEVRTPITVDARKIAAAFDEPKGVIQ